MKNNERKPRNQSKDEENHPAAFLGGGAAGAVAGAAAGSLAGPAGTIAGAAIGGLAGAKAGENLAEMPDEDDKYWREHFSSRPYAKQDRAYEDYKPAYNAGYAGYCEYGAEGRSFEDAETKVREYYEGQENKRFDWSDMREAARDSYNRSRQVHGERRTVEGNRMRQEGNLSVNERNNQKPDKDRLHDSHQRL